MPSLPRSAMARSVVLLLSIAVLHTVAGPCAVVDDRQTTRAFCAAGATRCSLGCSSGAIVPDQLPCTTSSDQWLQAAVYAAAAADAAVISIGAGLIGLQPLTVWQPLGELTGLHVPSNVTLRSACATGTETVLCPQLCNTTLSSLLLISQVITGFNASLDLPAAHDVSVRDLALDGRCCGQGESAATISGIAAGLTSGNILLQGLAISYTVGNAIDLGVLSSWSPGDPAEALRYDCNTTGFCAARVLGFNAPDNNLNQAQFGGITIIGSNAMIADNDIQVCGTSWQPGASFGTTMAVSAGFVGTANVTVARNRLRGADYAVGSDGSFPLYTTVPMYSFYWPTIFARQPPDFQARYPHGLPLDAQGNLAFATVDDYVTSHQILLDLAVNALAQSNDSSISDQGFVTNLVIRDNIILDPVCGISLYRAKYCTVFNNTIVRTNSSALAKFGVIVAASYQNDVSHNNISGWPIGVLLVGLPRQQSRWGASFNGVGVSGGNTVDLVDEGIVVQPAGYDNAVRNNNISAAVRACDFSGAQRLEPGDPDWTTNNMPGSCNHAYRRRD